MKSLLMAFMLLACIGPPPSQLSWADFTSWGDADEPRAQAFFSPDGTSMVTSLYTLNLWNSESGELQTYFEDSGKLLSRDTTQKVNFLRDGKRIITQGTLATRAGGNGRPPHLWDLNTGTHLGTFEAQETLPQAISLSSDEKGLWIFALPRETTDRGSVSFREVSGGTFVPQLELWDILTQTRKRVWKLPSRERFVALNSNFLVTLQGQSRNRFRASSEQPVAKLKVWDLRLPSPKPITVLEELWRLDHQAVVFSPNGRYLLVEHKNGADLFDLETKSRLRQITAADALAWSIDDSGKVQKLTSHALVYENEAVSHSFAETAEWAKISDSGHLLRRVVSKLQIHTRQGELLSDLGVVDFLDISDDSRFVATLAAEGKLKIIDLSKSVKVSVLDDSKMDLSKES